MLELVKSLEENLLLDGWYETRGLNKYTGEPNIYAYVGSWTLNLYMRQSGYGFTVKAINVLTDNIVQESSQDKRHWATREACKPVVIAAAFHMARSAIKLGEEVRPLWDSEIDESTYELYTLLELPPPKPKKERRWTMNRRV